MNQNLSETKWAAGFLLMTRQPAPSFLLMYHRPRKKRPSGRWDLPKGHCEKGESLLDAALRETEEETGIQRTEIEVDAGFHFELTYPVTYQTTGDQVFQKQVRYYLGYVSEPQPVVLTEHDSAEWIVWNPPHHIQSQTIDPLLEALHRYLMQ